MTFTIQNATVDLSTASPACGEDVSAGNRKSLSSEKKEFVFTSCKVIFVKKS
jgi:hypothetical protein